MHLLTPKTIENIARQNSPYTSVQQWNQVSAKTREPWRNIAAMTLEVISQHAVVIELPRNDLQRDVVRLISLIGTRPNVTIRSVINELETMEKSAGS